MKRIIAGFILALTLCAPAQAQQVNLYCNTGAGIAPWNPCTSTNPLAVSGTITSGSTSQGPITPATAVATTSLILGGQYNSTQATFTTGQQGALQISSRGEIKSNIFDSAGNARGANVNASNQLSVSVDNSPTLSALPAGTALIGKVGIDQTTPGTTNGVQVNAALPAGTNKIGNVGGSTVTVCVTPTVTSATYAANVVVGGLLTFSNLFTATGSGVIQSVSLNFTTAQTVGFKLYPFGATPTNATTWTDHSAASISGATDIFLTRPPINLSSADSSLGTMTNYSVAGLGQAYSTGGTSGFFVLVPTATTATLGGTANVVQVCVTVLQDL